MIPASDDARNWLGQHIRDLRTSKGLTLKDMADRTGLSSSSLSKVENGRLSVSFDKLLIIAGALDVSVSELLSRADQSPSRGRRSVTRRGRGESYRTPQYTYQMLCADLARKRFVPLLTRVETQDLEAFGPLVRHEGEEFVFVLDGEIDLHTEFYETTTLRPGDCAYLDSGMGHALTCREGNGRVLWITSNADPQGVFALPTLRPKSHANARTSATARPARGPYRTRSRRAQQD